jgi:polysaccharide export outer membrane protein
MPIRVLLLILAILVCAGASIAADGPEYRLGPKDAITVTIARHPDLSQDYIIPPEGTVDFLRIGRVRVLGTTIAALAADLTARYADSGLREPSISVVLKVARDRQVFALGAVLRPGSYRFETGVRITELVAAMGGLTIVPADAAANIMRGAKTLPIDLPGALSGVRPDANLLMEEGDVLWVQEVPKLTIVVSGQVKAPGMYRVKAGSTALDALAAAGDFTAAREDVALTLIRGGASRLIDMLAALADPRQNPVLEDGDMLWAQPVVRAAVVVAGEVTRPGPVRVRLGARLTDVLAAAGGVALPVSDVGVTLMRDGTTMVVDLPRALAGDPLANIAVRDNDVVWAQPLARQTVLISGAVARPGSYRFKDGARVVDAVVAAGDLTAARGDLAATLVRGVKSLPIDLRAAFEGTDPTANPSLTEGDVLWIQPVARTPVMVAGAVRSPGLVRVKDSATLVEALAAAGGFTDDPSDLVVTRTRGGEAVSMPLTDVLAGHVAMANTSVKDGDLIWVQAAARQSVVVSGLVKTPGAYRLKPGAALLDALAAAGGIAGQPEDVRSSLIRGTVVMPVDPVAALRDPAKNLALRDGDVVWVQTPARLAVLVSGQVRIPGAYRLREASAVVDALVAAGDVLGERKDLTASVIRGTRVMPVDLPRAYADPAANLALEDGDVLSVQPRHTLTVILAGLVRTPGPVRLKADATAMDALAASGDVTGDRAELALTIMRGGGATTMPLLGALTGAEPDARKPLAEGDVLWVQPQTRLAVVVSGLVRAPGSYRLRPGSTALDALAAAGDITGLREDAAVALMRGAEVTMVDLRGTQADPRRHPALTDGDLVWVQPAARLTIVVAGQMKAPGVFRLRPNAVLLDALAAAGGLVGDVHDLTAIIMRGGDRIAVDLANAAAGARQANLALQDGDVLWVQPAARLAIMVSGQVRAPGAYRVTPGAGVLDALAAAGGATGDTRDLSAMLMRGAEALPVDLVAATSGARQANLPLQDGDALWVQPLTTLNVVVAGQVARPGPVRLRLGSTALQGLAAAGDVVGIREELTATLMRGDTTTALDLARALVDARANPMLQDGDVLWVRPVAKMAVVVTGAVRSPGAYRLRDGSAVIDALAAAGDVLGRPERVRISLVRDGATDRITWGTARREVRDADIILVEQEPLSRVYINGHVRTPGVYEIPDGAGVLQALAAAGGALDGAAVDHITIVRAATNTQETVDLAPALTGIVKDNPTLATGDQIIVPVSTATVSVFGSVTRPGQLPVSPLKTLTITDAIAALGGPVKEAFPADTHVIRTVDGKVVCLAVNVNSIVQGIAPNFELQASDIVYVPKSNKTDWKGVLESLYRVGIIKTAFGF